MTGPVPGEARAARPDEAEAALQTLCDAFGLDADAARPIFYADPFYDLSHKRVLRLPHAGVVSCLTVVPAVLRVGGVPVPAGGIAGVATRPECQRRGHAAALLRATVPALWDELGYPLSLLHPLSAPFYRRFGWETASESVRWAAPPASLPAPAEAPPVRPAAHADWPGIYALHAELTQEDTGACVRDGRRWRVIRLPVPGREVWVTDGGYAVWERGEALHVLEMHARTPAARAALRAHLARQPEPSAEWLAPPALLRDFGLATSPAPPEPGAMLRLVDLPAALGAVHGALYAPALASAGATLTIQAADPLRPVNARPLRLTPDGVAPGTDSDAPWLRAGIGTLAALYLGFRTPSAMQAAGRLSCDSPAALALADRLFPPRAPYVAPLDQV